MDGGRDEFAQPAVYSLISCNSPEHHDTALDLDCHAVEQLDCVLKEVSKLSDYSPKGRCQEQLKALHDYTPSEESHFELQHNFHLLEDIAEEVELNKEYWQEQQASHVYGVEDPEDELHFLQDIPLTAFDKRIQSIEERYWPARTPSNEVIPPDLSRNARRRRIRKQKKTQRSTGPNDVAVTIEQPSNSSRFLSSNDSQDDAKKPRRQRTRKKKTKNQNA
ncbi:hypothetical protein CPB83DRAFT_841807 [Crepidotus variabilis]|uniref:Uncharacterized protein n=1 Tax=Crepidotus variabilis TaxID=179855 RepID=A0A9P6EU26_9AGAR|nr:hypothetical protein CPB83DRAFT_841807 [Crepidotus variabilis]